MKKNLFAGVLLAGALLCGAAFKDAWNTDSYLSRNPVVSGIAVNQLSLEDATELIGQNPEDFTIKIKGPQTTETVALNDLVKNPDQDGEYLTTLLKQRMTSAPLFEIIEQENKVMLDDKAVSSTLSKLKCVSGSEVTKTENASVSWNGYYPEISPEVQGDNADTKKLASRLEKALNNQEKSIDIVKDGLIEKPTLTEESSEIVKGYENLLKASDAVVAFDAGYYEPTISLWDFSDGLSVDAKGNVKVDRSVIKEALSDIKDDYGLYASKDEALKEKREMNGYILNVSDQAEKTASLIEKGESASITLQSFEISNSDVAKLLYEDNKKTLDSIKESKGDNFIYIDISDQFMWFFKNGEPLVATNVTTGLEGVHDTPTGDYELESKSTNVVLRGDDYASPVDYWLPFDGPYGIHDASWRSEYGGDFYSYNGSHGCVNTPYAAVATIYENITPGTPVIVR